MAYELFRSQPPGASDMFGFIFKEISYINKSYTVSDSDSPEFITKLTYYIQEISRPQRNLFCFKKKPSDI